jgi:hypothetical protein
MALAASLGNSFKATSNRVVEHEAKSSLLRSNDILGYIHLRITWSWKREGVVDNVATFM